MQSEGLRNFSQLAQYPKHVHASLRITSHSLFIVGATAKRSFSGPRNRKIIRHCTSLQYWLRYTRQCYYI